MMCHSFQRTDIIGALCNFFFFFFFFFLGGGGICIILIGVRGRRGGGGGAADPNNHVWAEKTPCNIRASNGENIRATVLSPPKTKLVPYAYDI